MLQSDESRFHQITNFNVINFLQENNNNFKVLSAKLEAQINYFSIDLTHIHRKLNSEITKAHKSLKSHLFN